MAVHQEAAIVRTSLIYGLHQMDNGTRSFAERLRDGREVGLFSDVLRQPVWVETLAAALLELAREALAVPLPGVDEVLRRWPR